MVPGEGSRASSGTVLTLSTYAVTGALLAGRLARILTARNLTWLGMLATGVFAAAFARQTSLAPALVLIFLLGIPMAALNAGIYPIMLAVTPKAFIGRTMAVFNPINMAASTVSVVLAGTLASTALRDFHATVAGVHIGRVDTVFTVSALLVIAAGSYGAFALPPTGTAAAEHEPPADIHKSTVVIDSGQGTP